MISHNTILLHVVSSLQITSGLCTLNRGIGENNQDMVIQWAFGDSPKVSQISFDTPRMFDPTTIEIQENMGATSNMCFIPRKESSLSDWSYGSYAMLCAHPVR